MQIHSIGVDIGTTTTQMVISRLTIKNDASAFTVPRIRITEKEIVYRSRVHFTPFSGAKDIDAASLLALLQAEFVAAGLKSEQISTGAVIITGEAARKSNANLVLDKLSAFSGQFVVSTAGPDLEGIIAGKGSGACHYSLQHDCCALNADIGGGTTNIAVFAQGAAIAYCCLDIGGRQLRLDADGRIEYISPSAQAIAHAADIPLRLGDTADKTRLNALAAAMAELISAQILGPDTPLLETIRTRGSSAYHRPPALQAVFLSGGVADCVFQENTADFPYGDLGVLLGRALKNSRLFREAMICRPTETLRATVVGAGVHLVSISGSTISFSPGLLPLRNVPVCKLSDAEIDKLLADNGEAAAERLIWLLKAADSEHAALAFTGLRWPTYKLVKRLSAALCRLYSRPELSAAVPILLIENDMAKALGQALKVDFAAPRPLICLDGVSLDEGDYVDLGEPIMHDMVIPLIVKTLVIG